MSLISSFFGAGPLGTATLGLWASSPVGLSDPAWVSVLGGLLGPVSLEPPEPPQPVGISATRAASMRSRARTRPHILGPTRRTSRATSHRAHCGTFEPG